ncbi:MAG: T9SS type A sorting domain-containing protein [Bacteroidia bacterium]|nr:T9SS type A sorting domain-containing protein [Bacteroidia bacterium]
MKKSYSLICATLMVLFTLNANAANINVDITNNAFSTVTNVMVNDVIVFNLIEGTHTVVGLSVPSGATAINSGAMTIGTPYNYTVLVAGNYGYKCGIHQTMVGGFQATGTTGILAPSTNLLTTAYPNPVKDKLTVKYDGLELIEVLNVIGEKIQTIALDATESKVEIDFSNLPSGMYFYRTYKEGAIVETKRIVKTK